MRRPLPFCRDYFFAEGLGLAAALSSFFALSALSVLAALFTSTSFAVMVYMIVTLSPTLRSPVTFVLESRATSNFSLPFMTVIMLSSTAVTGPVTW